MQLFSKTCTIEDLNKLVLNSKTNEELVNNIRNFFEMCEDATKKEFLELVMLTKKIEEVTIDELIGEYKTYVLPSLLPEHCNF